MAALQLLTFTPKPDARTSVPAEHVKDLSLEDFRVAQMYHNADADTKVAILHQLRAFYQTPASYLHTGDARGFRPVTRWWTRGPRDSELEEGGA